MNSLGSSLLFLCGFPSSGTDLLKLLLNAHPEVSIAGEFPLLPALAQRFSGPVTSSNVDNVLQAFIESDTYGNLKHRVLPADLSFPVSMSTVYRHLLGSESTKWTGNKTPQNAENVDRIEKLFPDSRYILIVRDVRDVALSWHRKWGKDPLLCAHKWQLRMNESIRLLQLHAPGRHMLITYESLIQDHVKVARKLCSFLEIEFSGAMEHFHTHVQETLPGKLNYGRPILKQNSEKWRTSLDVPTVSRIESIAFETMQEFGYAPIVATRARSITVFEWAKGNQRDVISMLTVGNRALRERPLSGIRSKIGLELSKRLGRYRTRR